MRKLSEILMIIFKKTVIGAFLLYVINVCIQETDLYIVINPFTAFLAGFLGLPGVLSLAAIYFFVFP
ncbi:pro-sigmaK processing inhibitor BofA family protein [Domibacillus indicus]|uniref:pro-sigmaK processing inhibitor BofA family protein n=1 Tax=Domibacillus indicus TaxID=1437523 RepID=UPI00203BF66D|nr:pro-sigmaK processing inhibitor BofA family protein [Domibacillus indicus]MCM3791585.1 pro-sigmaK processing inhibitor BofA family protein [Domibacillus indicus]